ncbi:MAG: ATP-binding protein [Acidobacteriota bacterium]|nr:ATP-binding protein [Acidobacteriota bacterium]
MQDFEKLGLFYLGHEYDLAAARSLDTPVLYDSRDLVTHAVCVGMTGSGKTGLCLSLVEEAAIDGVPVIAIDPKGDLGNVLLTFPGLSPAEFRPWIDEDEARRAGLSADAFAAQQAEAWRRGLAESGQDGARIERLRSAAEFAIYTPGSSAGLPVSVLSSLAAPPMGLRQDSELLAERALHTATSLLSLAGADAQPRSREHTLLTMVLTRAWEAGRDLDLAALVREVQSPPFGSVGVVDLDSFFPERDRFDLAMRFNGVLAAPGSEQWFEGEPLDPAQLLYTADGRPRVVVFSIAHLGDAERMFFVSLLLTQMLSWMRSLTGTSSLRAILYMDEISGFLPPVANPPSKPPLLTLLKQGRAVGLGVVLATQNPVDLDYKGLSNIGTWLLGRLQTERDKARVLDGLEGAAAGSLDRADADRLLSALGKRMFLLHNVHEQRPRVFRTRWALSYLRGPLSRDQIRLLMSDRRVPPRPVPAAPQVRSGVSAGRTDSGAGGGEAPVLPPGIQQVFIPPSGAGPATLYSPMVLGAARIAFSDSRLGVDVSRDVLYAARITDAAVPVDWPGAVALDVPLTDLRRVPEPGASFQPLPAAAAQPKNYASWQKLFSRWLAQEEKLVLLRHRELKLTSRPDETERDFRIRVQEAARSARDAAVEAVRQKYAARQAALAEQLRRADATVGRETEQASQQKLQTAVSFGATLFGALLGRKMASTSTLGRATTAVRGVGRSMKESSDVQRAAESAGAVRARQEQLASQLQEEARIIAARFDQAADLEHVTLLPKRGQVVVQLLALAWDPD